MIKKVIIPRAGLATRFLPLSRVLPKEFFPLGGKPVIQYLLEEALASGIKKVIFVDQPGKKMFISYYKKYFRGSPRLEKLLKKRGRVHLLKELKKAESLGKAISFSRVFQKKPLGDGDAVLKAEKLIKKQPCAVLFGDDVVDSEIPCLSQLIEVFEKYRGPVLALYPLPEEKISSYGIVGVKKIKGRVYQIKEIKEKPKASEAPSNLAIVGKYIITPAVFRFLKKAPPADGEIRLAGAFKEMLRAGLPIYGCKFEGKWLECGNQLSWLESNLYFFNKKKVCGK